MKNNNMNNSTYTKIVKTEEYNDKGMSLGFRRYSCLPAKTKKEIGIAYYMKTGLTNCINYVTNFFEQMTEAEYKQYILTH